ncbi:hypothetical protein FK531_14155 [Rhodococcus spelaei]|uniref:Iron reductase n=1 Tax=Rhodococcus spelaei TaxID=2546320 RepID=A0A541B840_9NOCA|nr:hypothetical protein FK531_14155 [Rhodococcus spelaei]
MTAVREGAVPQSTAALAESCTRLRAVHRDYPRVYAVAEMAEQPKRRWWALAQGIRGDRLHRMVARALEDVGDLEAAGAEVAAALIHAVVGRVAALVVLEGRAWDAGLDNLWIHMDSDGCIDWAGVADPVLRVLPGDCWSGSPAAVTVPCERALLMWTACRCRTALSVVFDALVCVAPVDRALLWAMVGESVLGAATLMPVLGGVPESVATRRGQGLLDAFEAVGVPVRARAERQSIRRPAAHALAS